MKAAELRQSILQMAVQGKLVPQDLHDESASELLERICAEKAQLVKERKIKKEKPLSTIAEDEIPYDLPVGWIWCRLGEVALFVATGPFGSMLHKSDYVKSGIPLVNPANMQNGSIVPSDRMQVDETTRNRLSSYVLHEDDIVVARRGDLGRCAVVTSKEKGWICGTGSFFLRLATAMFLPYFLLFFQSPLCREQLIGESVGTTMNNLNHTILKNVSLPLPPINLQKRIVAKVDELMVMCDELETAEKELDELESDFIEYLPKSILQMAVQGKLVPQNIHDEPASGLLERIRTERTLLIKEGKVKKEKPLPPIAEDEVPYDLPDGWVWCRLGDIAQFKIGKTPARAEEVFWNNGIYPWVSIADMKSGEHLSSTKEKISQLAFDAVFKGNITPIGSLLFSFKLSIGKVVILDIDAFTNEAICSITPYTHNEIIEYLFRVFPALDLLSGANDAIKGQTLNSTSISQLLIPIPPLAEQQRIVVKADELMALCDELKTARDITVAPAPSNIAPFPIREDEDEEIAFAARGDGESLPQEAIDDLNQLWRRKND